MCSPETDLKEMIRLVVENEAHRIWLVDGDKRPIGVVSLTNMISAIMKVDK